MNTNPEDVAKAVGILVGIMEDNMRFPGGVIPIIRANFAEVRSLIQPQAQAPAAPTQLPFPILIGTAYKTRTGDMQFAIVDDFNEDTNVVTYTRTGLQGQRPCHAKRFREVFEPISCDSQPPSQSSGNVSLPLLTMLTIKQAADAHLGRLYADPGANQTKILGLQSALSDLSHQIQALTSHEVLDSELG